MIDAARRILMAVLALLLVAGPTRVAGAQDGRPWAAMTYQTSDPTAQALEVANGKVRRGRTGIIVSSLITAGGVTLLGMSSPRLWWGGPPKGLVAVGAMATVGGLAGMLGSGIVLADGKRAKHKIQQRRAQFLLTPGGGVLRVRF